MHIPGLGKRQRVWGVGWLTMRGVQQGRAWLLLLLLLLTSLDAAGLDHAGLVATTNHPVIFATWMAHCLV